MPKKPAPDLKQIHTDFLVALSKMETRTDDGKRLIEVDQKHLVKCLKEAQKPFNRIMDLRRKEAYRTKYGYNKIKPEIIRANVIDKCREDIVYFANHWAWIFNPWLTRFDHMVEGGFSARLPFILFQKAEEYIQWREKLYRENRIGLVYKARELGVSWDNCLSQVWHWFFEDNFQGRFGSRKEGLVDSRGNPDTLFWKVRYIIYNTPSWFRHEDMKTRNNKWDSLLKIENPLNGAVLAGEGGDNIGTGGRAAMYDLDEWAKIAHDKMCESGLSANCRCRIYTATPNGMDNDYAEKFHSGKVQIFDFPWHSDPRKNENWLKNFEEDHDESIVAQEVHRKFDAFNVGQAIPPEWVLASVELYNRIESGAVPYEWGQSRHGGLDVAAGGRNRSVMMWREGIVVRDVLEWDIDNTTTLVEKSGTVAEEKDLETLNYDPIAVGVGVRSTFELSNYKFQAIPVDSRSTASEVPLPGDTRPARERCRNRRAELVCRARKRFERTFEFIEKKIQHPLETLIAIPDNSKLKAQLSMPALMAENGRWRLESKEQMVRRGVESPDYFDSCMLCFAEEAVEMRVLQSYKTNDDRGDFKVIPGGFHYVSIQHEKNLVSGAIAAYWYPSTRKLMVYDEIALPNPTVSKMVSEIRSRFNPNVSDYIGNREIFGAKDEEDSLFMQYLDSFLISENFQYNEMSAIAQVEEMIQHGMLHVHNKCQDLKGQLSTWSRLKGQPERNNVTLALALCNMVNHLQDQGAFEVASPKMRGPYSKGMPVEPVEENRWMGTL